MAPSHMPTPDPAQSTELGGRSQFPTRDLLAVAYACARTYGWVPASQDGSTKALVLQALAGKPSDAGEVLAEIEPHLEQGRDLVEEMMSAGRVSAGSTRGYASDLEQALGRELTPLPDVGLVCSAVARFVQPSASTSSPRVRVGERVSEPATVRMAVEVSGPASGRSMLVVFDTERGAMRVTTPAGWSRRLAVGERVIVEGVVSSLEHYRGRRRAVLSRVQVCGLGQPAGEVALTRCLDADEGGRSG